MTETVEAKVPDQKFQRLADGVRTYRSYEAAKDAQSQLVQAIESLGNPKGSYKVKVVRRSSGTFDVIPYSSIEYAKKIQEDAEKKLKKVVTNSKSKKSK